MNSTDDRVSCFVIGNYGHCNIGDEMLLKQVIKEVSNDYWGKINFYVPAIDMEFVRTYHQELLDQVTPIYVKDFKKIIGSLVHCKVIVVGGGGIWSGHTGFFAHFVPFISMLGKLLRKKVIFKSIGLYTTASTLDRFFVNLSILFSDMCSVRDNESYQMLWKINRNKKATRTDDLSVPFIKYIDEDKATLLPNITEYEKVRLVKDQGTLIVGISLRPMKKDPLLDKRIVEEFSSALNRLNDRYEQEIHFLFFPFAKTASRTDEEFIQRVVDNLKYKEKATIVSHTNPIAWYRAIKELTDLFIGMRYHSVIFSFMARKPVLSVPYEKKVVEFLKDYNRKNYPVVSPVEISESHIVEFIERYREKKEHKQEAASV